MSTTVPASVNPVALSAAALSLVEDRNTLALHSLPTHRTPKVLLTATLPDHLRLKILITGGAGFVGSHLCDKLMIEGHEVTVLDNFFTGSKKNIEHWLHHPNFSLIVHDVTEPIRLVSIYVMNSYEMSCHDMCINLSILLRLFTNKTTLSHYRKSTKSITSPAQLLLLITSTTPSRPSKHPPSAPSTCWVSPNASRLACF